MTSNVNSSALRLVGATLTQLKGVDDNNNSQAQDQTAPESTLFVYVSEPYSASVCAILDQHQIVYKLNYYQVGNWQNKLACFYHCRELNHSQAKYLLHILSHGGQVESLVHYLERQYQCTELALLDTEYLLDSAVLNAEVTHKRFVLRRFVDVGVALGALSLSWPIWLLIAALIKLESHGPIFYKQKRTGLFNREFEIIKFRSMVNDAERDGAQWASKNDSRITRVGKFLRMTRLDELPQLLNVLKGDMSLIGPRPEREVFVRQLETQIPFYRFRHVIRPGVTGWAQVSYSYGASVEDAVEKHRRDLFYIKHRSLGLDLKILYKTVLVVLRGQGV